MDGRTETDNLDKWESEEMNASKHELLHVIKIVKIGCECEYQNQMAYFVSLWVVTTISLIAIAIA